MAAADTLAAPNLPVPPSFLPPLLSTSKPRDDKLKPTHSKAQGQRESVKFDAKKHLEYTPPHKAHTMKELGYDDDAGVSSVGVSEPFPLFSAEAIKCMREEVLRNEVWEEYRFSSNLAQCQLRGYAPK